MAFPDTERLQNVSNPLRAVCLPLFKASPLWDGHFKLASAQLALLLPLSAVSSSLLGSKLEPRGWLVNSSEDGKAEL